MTPQFPKKLDENILQVDAYLDYELLEQMADRVHDIADMLRVLLYQ